MIGALREAFARDLAAPPEWLRAAGPADGRHLTVLVVEDDVDQADVVASHLAAAGHRPVCVLSGDQAVETARRERPDVTLLDVELPAEEQALHVFDPDLPEVQAPRDPPRPARQLFPDEARDREARDDREHDVEYLLELQHYAFPEEHQG